MKKIVFTILLMAISLAAPVFAEDTGKVSGDVSSSERTNIILPETNPEFTKAVTDEVGKKNDAEEKQNAFAVYSAGKFEESLVSSENKLGNAADFLNQPIKSITYDKDGIIKSVLYEDGTLVSYSYTFDENGKMTECIMETDEIRIIFRMGGTGKEESLEEDSVIISYGEGAGNIDSLNFGPYGVLKDIDVSSGKREVIIEIYDDGKLPGLKGRKDPGRSLLPRNPTQGLNTTVPSRLEALAKNPAKFDFEAINKAVTVTSGLQVKAFSEYVKNTADYYNKMESEIKDNKALHKLEDIKINTFIDKLYKDNTTPEERRSVIDETVVYIKSKTHERTENNIVREFSEFENNLRQTILSPERRAYEGRVKDALDHIYAVIDKLLTSKLVLYMNLKKEKIDVVIRLPKISDREKEITPQK